MDLFDLLEKVFRGIVYFIYNLVETIATTLSTRGQPEIRF